MKNNIEINRKSVRRVGLTNINNSLLGIAFLIVGVIIAFIILLDDDCPNYYKYLPMLPICHSIIVCICVFIKGDFFTAWHRFVAVILYSVRNLLTPLIMSIGNYRGYFRLLNTENVLNGLLLMVFETLAVLIFLAIYKPKVKTIAKSAEYMYMPTSIWFKFIISGMFLFCVSVYILMPTIRDAYTSIMSTEGIRQVLFQNTAIEVGSFSRSIFTLFQVVFPMMYMFLCVSLIVGITRLFNNRPVLVVILNSLVVLVPTMFMDGGDGNTFISMVTLFLTVLFVDKKHKKIYILILGLIGVIAALFIFISAMTSVFGYNELELWENVSSMLQAYFPGVCNFAGIFNIGEYNKLSEFFYDLYSTIPFRNTLFGLSDFETLPQLYTIDNNALSQIMPCFGFGFYYFSIFALIIPCYIYKKAVIIREKMKNTTTPFYYMIYSFLMLYLLLTPVMYNPLILLRHFLATLLPMLIICKLTLLPSAYKKREVRISDKKQI